MMCDKGRMITKTGQGVLNLQGYQDNKAPQTPGTRLEQPHGLGCDQRISEHAQGDGVRGSALMKTTYFIP